MWVSYESMVYGLFRIYALVLKISNIIGKISWTGFVPTLNSTVAPTVFRFKNWKKNTRTRIIQRNVAKKCHSANALEFIKVFAVLEIMWGGK